jgi:hypothetical protein
LQQISFLIEVQHQRISNKLVFNFVAKPNFDNIYGRLLKMNTSTKTLKLTTLEDCTLILWCLLTIGIIYKYLTISETLNVELYYAHIEDMIHSKIKNKI